MIVINYVVSLAAIAWVWIVHNESTHFEPGLLPSMNSNWDHDEMIPYSIGKFDLATWTCDLNQQGAAAYSMLCTVESAQLYLMVPFAGLNFICVCSGIWAYTVDRQLAQKEAEERDVEEKGSGTKVKKLESDRSTDLCSPTLESKGKKTRSSRS